MKRVLLGLTAAFCVFAVGAIGTAGAAKERLGEVEIRLGKLVLTAGGSFHPSSLPKREHAPIVLRGHGELESIDGSVPPTLERIVIDFDRNGHLETQGLPICRPSQLEATTVPVGRKRCPDAIVGKGVAAALVAFPEQRPFKISSAVTVFNGPVRQGDPTAIVHAYTTIPIPTTFVVVVRIQKVRKGRYGYEVVVDVPRIAGGAGRLVEAEGFVHRLYSHGGRKRSYVSARCADGRLQAKGAFSFDDGTFMTGSAFRPCTVRR